MNSRRRALMGLWAAAVSPGVVWAAQRASLADPLRFAADDALVDSGLAAALQRGFGRDTGVAIQLLRGPASTLLAALARGEHDVALANAPQVEADLAQQGLIHDVRPFASTDFVLTGPTALAKALAAESDASLALARLAQAQAPFITLADGSGTHLAEQALWRSAKIAPAAPWYTAATPGSSLLAQARAAKACTLVERGVWAAAGAGKGYGVLVAGDPRMAVDVRVMRSFHAKHPGGTLFADWITGPHGRRVLASLRAYRAAKS